MPFRLRRDTRSWFRHLENDFGKSEAPGKSDAPLFDMYYLCLMAGLAGSYAIDNVTTADTTELVDNFPGEYREKGRLIIGFFLSRELKRLGIGLTEREALHTAISGLVDPQTPSRLSDAGMKQMNQYGYGGFELLATHFDDKPRHLETFLPMYAQMIEELNQNQ